MTTALYVAMHMLGTVVQELHFRCSSLGRRPAIGTHCSWEWCRKVHSHVTFERTAEPAIKVREGRIEVLEGKGMIFVSCLLLMFSVYKFIIMYTAEG